MGMGEEKCPKENWSGTMPRQVKGMRGFGETCVGLEKGRQNEEAWEQVFRWNDGGVQRREQG